MRIQLKITLFLWSFFIISTVTSQTANIYYKDFLLGNPSGGGNVSITLNNDLVSINFNAGFQDAKIKYNTPIAYVGDLFGFSFDVSSFNSNLTFIKSNNSLDTNGIRVEIVGGWIYLFSENNTDYFYKNYNNQTIQGAIIQSSNLEEDYNSISSINYDIQGSVKARNKNYYNDLGKFIQGQTVDIKTNKVWVNESLYDVQGRVALQTLSSPAASGPLFFYKEDFIENDNDNTYTSADFEDTPESPSQVGDNPNTLGWYYSSENSSENYQDITDYPFSRTIYSELNPGAVLKTIGGNKQDGEWKQGYTFSMPAGDELTQSVAFGDASYEVSDTRKIIKTVNRDVHGREAVMFTDIDGKTLAAARVGNSVTRDTEIIIGEQGFVDVHVPVAPVGVQTGFTINGVSGITTEVYDLITEQKTTAATNTIAPGFYRVSITNLESYDPANDPLTVTCQENYYDYSLNEYDEAGRLTASYQPIGNTKAAKPKSTFEYNALGQLLSTTSPDEGTTNFKYRKDGQIRFSQNSKQLAASPEEFSYTNYDDLGRPIESGVATGSFSALNADTSTVTTSIAAEKQETTYDALVDTNTDNIPDELYTLLGSSMVQNYIPTFLAGNVARTDNDNTTTYYSYDVYGRVKWIVQYIPGMGATTSLSTKTIDYEYNPVTGLVNRVLYQKGQSDQFIHRYTYDAIDDSLVKVETSTNGSTYTTHAEYKYYETGALKRVELAPYQNTGDPLQSVDYVYNLNGQLKAINPTGTIQSGDKDDLFTMQIDYHGQDYSRNLPGQRTDIQTPSYGENQYNGNIKGVRWKQGKFNDVNENTYSYYYNENNWLTDAVYGQYTNSGGDGSNVNIADSKVYDGGTTTINATNSITLLPGFHAKSGTTLTAEISGTPSTFQTGEYNVFDITYDANGNIRTLNRNMNGTSGNNAMDQLSYNYNPQKPNQLQRVDDAAGQVLPGTDLDDQDGENYVYNEIGQLVKNKQENIVYIYNASGLVTEVKQGGQPRVKFFYNDRGHRVKKVDYTLGTYIKTTYYVRDVSGNVVAIYNDPIGKAVTVGRIEYSLYGTSRLGVRKVSIDYGVKGGAILADDYMYQLTDHLGNVRAVAQWSGTNATALVATDYYPFGMPMPGRDIVGDYRYGYQGEFAEKEPEIGSGINSFQLRLYDSRIGRWISPDPYGQFHSPYLAMGNNPVSFADSDGGCTTPGGRPCAFSVMGGTATDSQGKVWSQDIDGNLSLETPFALNAVYLVGTSPSLLDKFMDYRFPDINDPWPEYKVDWGDYSSGSIHWGNQSYDVMGPERKRGRNGVIYGSWDFNEMVIPGAVGGQMKFWLHKQNLGKHFVRGVQTGVGAVEQGNGLREVLIAPVNNDTITYILQAWKNNVHHGGVNGEFIGNKNADKAINEHLPLTEWDSIQKVKLYGN